MDNKVLLYDAANAKVGETFLRRARQLVNRQRAEWVDDTHSAIRFYPDDDGWEAVAATPADESMTENRILAIAEKRLRERKHFIWLSIAFFPVLTLCLMMGEAFGSSEFFFFLFGCWLTFYAVRGYAFVKNRLRGFRPANREERYAKKLAGEVEKLKRMGYMLETGD